MNYKKVVVAVDMNEASLKTLSQINNFNFPKDSEIHLVHVFEINFFSFDFIPSLKPTPENYFLIEKAVEERLVKVKKQLGLDDHEKVVLKCLISGNAKQEFLGYADRNGATLIIAASQEKEGFKGLFESSFTNFLNKFSTTSLIILRPTT